VSTHHVEAVIAAARKWKAARNGHVPYFHIGDLLERAVDALDAADRVEDKPVEVSDELFIIARDAFNGSWPHGVNCIGPHIYRCLRVAINAAIEQMRKERKI
jgi:hypothetical protein